MKELATEKAIAKLAVRIGDRAHDLAQTYIKLLPTLAPAQKAYDESERIAEDLDIAWQDMIDAGLLTEWPDMLADLRTDALAAEAKSLRLGDVAFELETKLEQIESALYHSDRELR